MTDAETRLLRIKEIVDRADKALQNGSRRTVTPAEIIALRHSLGELLQLIRGSR